jgi:hypothetical protein
LEASLSRVEDAVKKNSQEVLLLGAKLSHSTADLLVEEDDSSGAAEFFGVAWLVNAVRSTLKRLKHGSDLSISEATNQELIGLRDRLKIQAENVALIMHNLRRFEGYKEILLGHRAQITSLIERRKVDTVLGAKTEEEFLHAFAQVSLRVQCLESETLCRETVSSAAVRAKLTIDGGVRLKKLALASPVPVGFNEGGISSHSRSSYSNSTGIGPGGKIVGSSRAIGASPLKILMQNLFQTKNLSCD